MSIYLQSTTDPEGTDPNMLELKVHYILKMLADAGLLKDHNNKAFTNMTADVTGDAALVQAAIDPKSFS
jgi:hypothetical protein